MVAGQVSDIEGENNEYSNEMLEYIHINKTGALIISAIKAGLYLSLIHIYLLKTRQEVLCLRQYEVLAFSNGQASRYTLKEVNASLQRKLCEPCGTLDEFCRQNYDKGAAEMNLNGTDTVSYTHLL